MNRVSCDCVATTVQWYRAAIVKAQPARQSRRSGVARNCGEGEARDGTAGRLLARRESAASTRTERERARLRCRACQFTGVEAATAFGPTTNLPKKSLVGKCV